MMKKLFILACVCLLITSCNSNSKNTNDSAISTETTDMHLSLIHISEPTLSLIHISEPTRRS